MTNKKHPSHTLWRLPTEEMDPKEQWLAVGAAWSNRDGSLNVVVNKNLPEGARLQLRARPKLLEQSA